MKGPPFALSASLLCVLAFAGFNLAANRWLAPVRADFTDGQLYTLSTSARQIVQRLEEPVDLELVFTRGGAADYPALGAHAGRVREMLTEIGARSGGRIRFRETDPGPYSEEEDRVALAGVQPLDPGEGDPIYLGLIGRNSVDDQIVIPFLSPDRDALLEYDLVRLIAQLDNPEPVKVAIITDLPAFGGDGRNPGEPLLMREMGRAFRIEPMLANFLALPQDAKVLVMLQPPQLSDWQAYVVDQFLVGGGRALIAVDPAAIAAAEAGRSGQSGLGKLETTLGVALDSGIAQDAAHALPVEVDAGQGRRRIERDPQLMGLEGERLSRADPVTADLTRMVTFSQAGSLVASKDAPRFEPLMTASPVGESDAAPVLAARISGRLRSAFAGPPPEPRLPQDPMAAEFARAEIASLPPFQAQGAEDAPGAEVILVADTDLFDARLFANPADDQVFADNAAFVLNALDNLSGDAALVALRSRAPAARPMVRLEEMAERGRKRLAAEEPPLRQRLAELESRMQTLMAAPAGSNLLRGENADALAALRTEAGVVRTRLRELQRSQRAELDALEQRLTRLNVWAPPILVGLAGLGVFLLRSRRRRRT